MALSLPPCPAHLLFPTHPSPSLFPLLFYTHPYVLESGTYCVQAEETMG